MKTRLLFALALSVLAANAFASDGYDRTGSAAHNSQSGPLASATYNHSGSAAVAAGGFSHTGMAGTLVASGGGNGGGSDGSDRTALGRIDS